MTDNDFSGLEQLLSDAFSRKDSDDPNDEFSPNKGADALSLSELAARYSVPNPFQRGDLVTPRRGYNLKGAGRPCVVLDVFPPMVPKEDKGGFIDFNDMRIARVIKNSGGQNIVKVYAESIDYERYMGPIAP